MRRSALVSFLAVLAMVAAACSSNGGGGTGTTGPTGGTTATGGTGEPVRGGILREETTDFGFTNAFDPTGEYLGSAWAIYGNFLMRGLVSTRGFPAIGAATSRSPTSPPTPGSSRPTDSRSLSRSRMG